MTRGSETGRVGGEEREMPGRSNMSSSGTFARVALVAAVSVVLGISTLAPLLKQSPAPALVAEDRVTPFVLAAPRQEAPVRATVGEESAAVPRPMKTAVARLTIDAPAPATPQSGSPAAMAPAGMVVPAAVQAPAAPAAAVPAAAHPAFPPMQVDDGSAAAQAAAQPATMQPPGEPTAERQRKNEKSAAAKRAADRAKQTRIHQTPFSYRDQLAAH